MAREQIRVAQTGYMPTINMSASTVITDTKYSGSSSSGDTDSNTGPNKIGWSINLPLYSGGATNSQIQQAHYSFVGASESLESAHRSLVQTVRSLFNSVNASISSINAYKQAVVSAQSSMDAMEAGYTQLARNSVDPFPSLMHALLPMGPGICYAPSFTFISASALISTLFPLSLASLLGKGEDSPNDGINNDETDKKHQPRNVPQILEQPPRGTLGPGDQRSLYADWL